MGATSAAGPDHRNCTRQVAAAPVAADDGLATGHLVCNRGVDFAWCCSWCGSQWSGAASAGAGLRAGGGSQGCNSSGRQCAGYRADRTPRGWAPFVVGDAKDHGGRACPVFRGTARWHWGGAEPEDEASSALRLDPLVDLTAGGPQHAPPPPPAPPQEPRVLREERRRERFEAILRGRPAPQQGGPPGCVACWTRNLGHAAHTAAGDCVPQAGRALFAYSSDEEATRASIIIEHRWRTTR